MTRFLALGLLVVTSMVALFALGVDLLGLAPRRGAVLSPGLVVSGDVAWRLALGSWLLEATGLAVLFLLIRGRCGAWWLDGLAAGSIAWVFRGPLLVVTIVVATGQPQSPWWRVATGWWLLYLACGLVLAALARRGHLDDVKPPTGVN